MWIKRRFYFIKDRVSVIINFDLKFLSCIFNNATLSEKRF